MNTTNAMNQKLNRKLQMPDNAFTEQWRVRSYEVGSSGVIGLSTALRYCEALATEDSAAKGFPRSWYENHQTAWVVRDMYILLGALPQIGDTLQLATWVSEYRRVQAQREYLVWLPTTGKVVARAYARWAYYDGAHSQLARIPDEILAAILPTQPSMHTHHLNHANHLKASSTTDFSDGSRSQLTLQARSYESDTQQHINNCVYADWISEAFIQAVQANTPAIKAAAWRPRFYHIEYLSEALPGQTIQIETKLLARSTHGLTSHYLITQADSGTPVLRATAEHLRTGA